MIKKITLLLLVAFAMASAKAQTAEEVYNHYLDFNLARVDGVQGNAIQLGENLIPDTSKLPAKARINFFYSMGKLYEDDSQTVRR
jgi:hypothetical protein